MCVRVRACVCVCVCARVHAGVFFSVDRDGALVVRGGWRHEGETPAERGGAGYWLPRFYARHRGSGKELPLGSGRRAVQSLHPSFPSYHLSPSGT